MGSQVITNDQLVVVVTEFMKAIMDTNVCHNFGSLAVSKGGVCELSFGVQSPSQNVLTLFFVVAMHSTHRVKPGFLDTNHIILPIIIQELFRSTCMAALCLLIYQCKGELTH
jgi:hypothetical protein